MLNRIYNLTIFVIKSKLSINLSSAIVTFTNFIRSNIGINSIRKIQ
jgi:hypothetical protein